MRAIWREDGYSRRHQWQFFTNWLSLCFSFRCIAPWACGFIDRRPLTREEIAMGQSIWQEFKEREPERAAELEAYHDRCDRAEEEWRRLPWWRRLRTPKPRR